MPLELRPPLPPMEAQSVTELPVGKPWQYEPKWDGFRCLAFRDRDNIYLQSKSGQPLARYFPDLTEKLLQIPAKYFVLDGEIVIPVAGRLSFDDLLLRIHPAQSRVRKLAAEYPAMLVVFDLLADKRGKSLTAFRLEERRDRLEEFAATFLSTRRDVRLSPMTTNVSVANKWFRAAGGNLDGIIAKRRDLPYRAGERDGMQKFKHRLTADCVVGGFRYAEKKKVIGSLLLGLYDDSNILHHIGFTSSFTAMERKKITKIVEPLITTSSFTGRTPGAPSRWSTRRSAEWKPVKPRLVVEVEYDHFTGGRFRHGTRLLRWRPDKAPQQCTLGQVQQKTGSMLKLLNGALPASGKVHSSRSSSTSKASLKSRGTAKTTTGPRRKKRLAMA